MKVIKLICAHCGIEFEKEVKEYNRQKKNGRDKFFCCQSHASIANGTIHTQLERKCLQCGKLFVSSTHKRHRKCCSIFCAKKYAHEHVDTHALSLTMKRMFADGKIGLNRTGRREVEPISKSCCICGRKFSAKPYNTRKTCGVECFRKLLAKNSRKMFENRVANGTWTSWRKNTEPSYPERFFMKVLDGNRIPYEYEMPFGRYSIDFAMIDKKIALEIDGQQHRFTARRESDKRKDAKLHDAGWKVFRICWTSPRTEKGKVYLKSEIGKFLDLYHSC